MIASILPVCSVHSSFLHHLHGIRASNAISGRGTHFHGTTSNIRSRGRGPRPVKRQRSRMEAEHRLPYGGALPVFLADHTKGAPIRRIEVNTFLGHREASCRIHHRRASQAPADNTRKLNSGDTRNAVQAFSQSPMLPALQPDSGVKPRSMKPYGSPTRFCRPFCKNNSKKCKMSLVVARFGGRKGLDHFLVNSSPILSFENTSIAFSITLTVSAIPMLSWRATA